MSDRSNPMPKLDASDESFVDMVMDYLEGNDDPQLRNEFMSQLRGSARRQQIFASVCFQDALIHQILIKESQETETHDQHSFIDALNDLSPPTELPVVDISDEMRHRKIDQRSKALAERDRISRLGSGHVSTSKEVRHYVIPKPLFYGCVATIITIAILIVAPFFENESLQSNDVDDRSRDPVARLTTSREAVWSDPMMSPAQGQTMLPGMYELKSGSVVVGLFEGSEVSFTGPATFELVGTNAGAMSIGTASIFVPERAKGFTFDVPGVSLVDLGTRFTVDTTSRGSSEIGVTEGLIEMVMNDRNGNRRAIPLKENESAHVDAAADGFEVRIPFEFALHNTGTNLRVGDQDMNWTVFNDAQNRAVQPAMVSIERSNGWQNDPQVSQWISLPAPQGMAAGLPGSTTLIFKQVFELPEDVDLQSVEVRLRFIVDDSVTIQLNGQSIVRSFESNIDLKDVQRWRTFTPVTLDRGFKIGHNEITFHVGNAHSSPMGLRVEFESAAGQRLIQTVPQDRAR